MEISYYYKIYEGTSYKLAPAWDNANGYTIQQLYYSLYSDVQTPQQFRNRLLEENNNLDQADVQNLFEAYYWN